MYAYIDWYNNDKEMYWIFRSYPSTLCPNNRSGMTMHILVIYDTILEYIY